MRVLAEWWQTEVVLARLFGWSWHRALDSLRVDAVWTLGRPLLVVTGRWRCLSCGESLGRSLADHVCPLDDAGL